MGSRSGQSVVIRGELSGVDPSTPTSTSTSDSYASGGFWESWLREVMPSLAKTLRKW
jgi:hypothetical protein